jgi:DNA repair protein SbcD/Mre11
MTKKIRIHLSRRLRRFFRKFWSEMLKNRKKSVKFAKKSAQSAGKMYPNLFCHVLSISINNMKILHTADWHLGKRLDNHVSRHEEQVAVLNEIVDIADRENVDVVLIAGDLFDNFTPSVESSELLYSSCKRLTNNGLRPVIAIAGNHDSPHRIEMTDALTRSLGILFAGFPETVIPVFELESGIQITRSDKGFVELKLPKFDYPLQLLLTPYANEYRLRRYLQDGDADNNLRTALQTHWQQTYDQYFDTERVCILMTHLFFTDPNKPHFVEPDDEKPILHIGGAAAMFPEHIPDGVQYVALGHLHRAHTVSNTPCPIVYSGSPLAYSFNEDNQQKYVQIIDIEPNQKVVHRKVALQSGRRMFHVQFQTVEAAIDWLEKNQNIWVLLTLETDDYLSAFTHKRLKEVHDGLITIIPLLRADNQALMSNEGDKKVPKTMQNMFIDYFKYRQKGLAPSQSLMDLFEEVLGENVED